MNTIGQSRLTVYSFSQENALHVGGVLYMLGVLCVRHLLSEIAFQKAKISPS